MPVRRPLTIIATIVGTSVQHRSDSQPQRQYGLPVVFAHNGIHSPLLTACF